MNRNKSRPKSEMGIFVATSSTAHHQASAAELQAWAKTTAASTFASAAPYYAPVYVSPLTAIHQAVRRQNPVAANAAATMGPSSTAATARLRDSSDPWDSLKLATNFRDTTTRDRLRTDSLYRRNSSADEVDSDGFSQEQQEHHQLEKAFSSYRSIRPTSYSRGLSLDADVNASVSSLSPNRSAAPVTQPNTPLDSTSAAERQRRLRAHSIAAGHGHHTLATSSPGEDLYLQEPQHAQALLQSTPHLRIISPASTDADHRNFLQRIMDHSQNWVNSNPNGAILTGTTGTNSGGGSGSAATTVSSSLAEYRSNLLRDKANQQAAAELASLLWVLAHEMTLEDYGTVESQVFTAVFSLVHAPDEKDKRMAGLAALDALLAAPSADEEKKAIKFANTLSTGLRAAHHNGDQYEYLSAVSKALGHMATRTANVDLVESEVTRALEWLRTERSDRRLAACLSLKEFAIHAPTTFHSKTSQSALGQGGSNDFLDHIFQAIRDPQPIVRACAADALSQCLTILVERRHSSLTGLLCQVHFALMDGLNEDTSRKRPWHAIAAAEASQHGSLLVVSTMLACTGDFMIPRFEEVCRAVLSFTESSKALIRFEVVRLIPRLASRCPRVFGRRYLEQSLEFLMQSASTPTPPRVGVDIRPSAFAAIGQMILAMIDPETGQVIGGTSSPTIKIIDDPDSGGRIVERRAHGIIYEKLSEIFALVKAALQTTTTSGASSRSPEDTSVILSPALHCGASLVAALGDLAKPYLSDLIDEMFRTGLSNDLIQCLQSIAQCAPDRQAEIEVRMLQEVSVCLAGMRNPLSSSPTRASGWQAPSPSHGILSHPEGAAHPQVVINMSDNPEVVRSLVLSLQTLESFGGTLRKSEEVMGNSVPLLPFVHGVARRYLAHPSEDVRRAAALTCCALLPPFDVTQERRRIGGHTGVVIEDILETLTRAAMSDPSAYVRLCVVQALDSRFDAYLCQRHHLRDLFLLLQDEDLSTRAAGLRLLGRLSSLNPAPVLPVLRRFLNGLIVELQCGVDTGRGREDATRLLVVFLRIKSLQRLIRPVLSSLINALPLDGTGPPRLASASLEALGELARAAGEDLRPWLKEVVPHVLEIMQDQSSASKQRTSLRTLGQISGSTGYVIRPYFDYPKLLVQATDILPATKRAPWSLRREVLRTLGILGALDPDRYDATAPKVRKGGAVGGAYFETDLGETTTTAAAGASSSRTTRPLLVQQASSNNNESGSRKLSLSESVGQAAVNDEDLPAYLFMYEQYTTGAQPVSDLQPAKRMTLADDDFYPTVAIQALMRIFCDPNLAAHHGMVIQAVMYIFKSMGLGCVPYMKKVVPHMISTVRTCVSSNLREATLQQLANLSLIVREHLRPYVADIFDVVEIFWSSRHLATIFSLISNIAVGVPDAFNKFIPRLIRRLVTTFDELQIVDWAQVEGWNSDGTERLQLLLTSLSSLKGVLGDYLHVLVPALLKLADSLASLGMSVEGRSPDRTLVELYILVLRTISTLVESQNAASVRVASPLHVEYRLAPWAPRESSEKGLPSRVVQPLVRLLRHKPTRSPDIGMALVDTLCVCASLIGGPDWVNLYDGVVREAIRSWQQSFPVTGTTGTLNPSSLCGDKSLPTSCLQVYDDFVEDLLKEQVRPVEPTAFERTNLPGTRPGNGLCASDFAVHGLPIDNTPEAYDQSNPTGQAGASRHKVNQVNLQRAWDVSQRASPEDWDEWMRRFAIQLLREAPAPSLRSAASLAHAYQPLARELFSAAFAYCWKELSHPYRANLVHALESAFVANVSPEILQALLNLAEFMEHDPSGGLPIEIPILADLALKCRAYAKALHYKEREYSLGGANSCVEALISINRKLDLQEAALGVLKASSLGEPSANKNPRGDDIFTNFTRHESHDMCYSVIWSTETRQRFSGGATDRTANEELWLAKLGSWTEALAVYENTLKRNPNDFEAVMGCMRCLGATGEWRKVLELAQNKWEAMTDVSRSDDKSRSRRKAVRICAEASWRLGQWDELEKFAGQLVGGNTMSQISNPSSSIGKVASKVDFDGAFYNAVLFIHRREWAAAAEAIDAARKEMDGRLTALMAESYSRAYPSMVTAQTLAEMEEIIEFRKLEERAHTGANQHPANRPNVEEARTRLLSVWRDRLAGCRVDAEVHSSILAVRSLVLGPDDEVEATLTLSELSRQTQRHKFAERVLLDPLEALGADLNGVSFGVGLPDALRSAPQFSGANSATLTAAIDRVMAGDLRSIVASYGPNHEQWSKKIVAEAGGLRRLDVQHRLYFAYVKHMWFTDRKKEAMARLSCLCDVVDTVCHCEHVADTTLRVACWLELGDWKISHGAASPGSLLTDSLKAEVLTTYKRATLLDDCGYRAWHAWALLNFRIALQQKERQDRTPSDGAAVLHSDRTLRNHVVAAVKGFVNAICLGTRMWSASVQQDLLSLLTCLFKYGKVQDIATVINDSIGSIAIEAWFAVLPQMLARIHIKDPSIRSVLHPLLIRLGEKHPQALMYPLSVLRNSPVVERKTSAESLMNSLKAHSSALVEEAQMVSSELIRVAILWLEMWHEGLEDASRLYFGDGNVSGMLELLFPLHEMIERGPQTRQEQDFLESHGSDLAKAHIFIREYARLVSEGGSSIPTGAGSNSRTSEEAETAMNRAWDIYYIVFRKINKQLPSLTKLELSQCSPALSNARDLELGVPGTYNISGKYIKIDKVSSSVEVITSKQRPRKITMRGGDGKNYVFLLKGHEDIRQDERVMQLFGLVNKLLARDAQTKKHDLTIQRYAISALSHNCGLVGWVENADTMHSLIRDYRQAKKVPLNMENREMLRIAQDYDLLTVMQKVEVFTEALRKTTGHGNDLYEILWLKSTNSEEWLERRTRFTRSLAIMSMVGYILGLGDRHPSNLMLDKVSGRILHIDFGDCFEVAMNRDKFPEKVPFRLTRMLVKAMEVSGIEGSYRSTCERTMSVLRGSRDSLVTMLEAFVYDPLISWRLADLSPGGDTARRPSEPRDNRTLQGGGVPINASKQSGVAPVDAITEHPDEDDMEDEGGHVSEVIPPHMQGTRSFVGMRQSGQNPLTESASRVRSLQMYSNIQNLAANLATDSRIASITGERSEQVAAEGSLARSRIERSMKHRELLSLLRGGDGTAHEEALNEKALKVIRRVEDKLTGTDFPDCAGEPLDVADQVQRLIVQATNSENLCQLFIGWCSFW